MTTTTTTRDSGISLRCTFLDEQNHNRRCAWVASAGTVDEMRGEYSRHWRSVHSDPPPGRQIHREVSEAKASGRWLDELVQEISAEGLEPLTEDPTQSGERVELVPIDRIDQSPYQTRAVPEDSVGELAESIRSNGQVVPATARRHPGNPQRYQLAYGHRRLVALKLLAQEDPVRFGVMRVVVQDLDDGAMIRAVAGENTGRRDLTQLETARAIKRLLDESAGVLQKQQIAEAFGIAPSTLSNMLRIQESFDETQLKYVEAGRIAYAGLRPLLWLIAADGHRHDDWFKIVVEKAIKDAGTGVPGEKGVQEALNSKLRALGYYNKDRVFSPLDKAALNPGVWYSTVGDRVEEPIDVAAYEKLAPGRVHRFGAAGAWGCDLKAWKKLVARRTKPGQRRWPELRQQIDRHISAEVLPAAGANPGTLEKGYVLPELHELSYPEKRLDGPLGKSLRHEIDLCNVNTAAVFKTGHMSSIVVIDDRVSTRMDDRAGCDTCVDGRSYAMGAMGPQTGPVMVCSNNECLAGKLKAFREKRDALVVQQQQLDIATLERAKVAVAFPGKVKMRLALNSLLIACVYGVARGVGQGELLKVLANDFGLSQISIADQHGNLSPQVTRIAGGVIALGDSKAAELAVVLLGEWASHLPYWGPEFTKKDLNMAKVVSLATGTEIPELSGGKDPA